MANCGRWLAHDVPLMRPAVVLIGILACISLFRIARVQGAEGGLKGLRSDGPPRPRAMVRLSPSHGTQPEFVEGPSLEPGKYIGWMLHRGQWTTSTDHPLMGHAGTWDLKAGHEYTIVAFSGTMPTGELNWGIYLEKEQKRDAGAKAYTRFQRPYNTRGTDPMKFQEVQVFLSDTEDRPAPPEPPAPSKPKQPSKPKWKNSGVKFSDLSGRVSWAPPWDPDDWRAAKLDDDLPEDAHIQTGVDSYAVLSFDDMTTFVQQPECEIVLTPPEEKASKLGLVAGRIWVNLKRMLKDGSMKVEMSQAVAGIKGTIFTCEESAAASVVKVLEDGPVEVEIKATGRTVVLRAGDMIRVCADGKVEQTPLDVAKESAAWASLPVGRSLGIGKPLPPLLVTAMTLRAESRKAKAGETVTVPVRLLKGAGLIDLNFNLEYDASVVQAAGNVVKGNLLDGGEFEANTAQAGVVQFGLVPKTGGIGNTDGTLAHVAFKVVGQPGSRTVLRLVPRKGTLAGGAAANPATVHGEIQIVGDDGFVSGDVSGDDKTDMADVMMVLKISVGLLPHNPRADVDKDGQVTAADARLIREKVLGIKG